jgi:cell division protein FtsL
LILYIFLSSLSEDMVDSDVDNEIEDVEEAVDSEVGQNNDQDGQNSSLSRY